jgi:flagellar biosynthesis protein FliR
MSLQLPEAGLVALLLASIRAGVWLALCPPLNSPVVPMPIKALLSVGLALPMLPQLTTQAGKLGAAAPALLVGSVEQAVVGAALGLLTSLFFAAIQAAGDLIDLFGGFSVAFAFDPLGQSQSSVFGRFYHMIAVTLLFTSGGYELVLRGFLRTFETLPLDGTLSLSTLDHMITHGFSDMFVATLQIAGPMVAVLFCADIALGLLNRVAPALNAFSMGFPLKILLVLSLGGLGLGVLPAALHGLVDNTVTAIVTAAGG